MFSLKDETNHSCDESTIKIQARKSFQSFFLQLKREKMIVDTSQNKCKCPDEMPEICASDK
jgi:hypothetical protein